MVQFGPVKPIESVKAIGGLGREEPGSILSALSGNERPKDLIPGAKKAMGVIKGIPDIE